MVNNYQQEHSMQPLIFQIEQLAVGEQIAVKCFIPLNSHFVFKAEVSSST